MLVWTPASEMSDIKIDEYIAVAKEKYSYNTEQALGMLFWHKHSIDKALGDLPNFTPFPDEWNVEDKVLFEQAFNFHGKSFHRIRQMLPDKSIASLVKYYYSWKRTRSKTSLMDKNARRLMCGRDDSDDAMDTDGSTDSDIDNTRDVMKDDSKSILGRNSGVRKLDVGSRRSKHKPPRGMYLNKEDLMAVATGPPGQGDAILRQLDVELVTLRKQVQNNKQGVSLLRQRTCHGIKPFRPPEETAKINSRWTNDEHLLAVQGLRKYGKNFAAIAEIIGNKTESHIRSFLVTCRRRYNLDEVLAEHEKEFGKDESNESEDKQIVEGDVRMDENVSQAVAMVTSTAAPSAILKQPVLPLAQSSPLKDVQQNETTSSSGNANKTFLQQPPPLIRTTPQKL